MKAADSVKRKKTLKSEHCYGILHINWAVGNSLMGPFPEKTSPGEVRTSGVLKQGHASLQGGPEVSTQILIPL